MAQNLDHYRTFPRLAGGKGLVGPGTALSQEVMQPEKGGPAGTETWGALGTEPELWQFPGLVQITCVSECILSFIQSFISKKIMKHPHRHFLDTGCSDE